MICWIRLSSLKTLLNRNGLVLSNSRRSLICFYSAWNCTIWKVCVTVSRRLKNSLLRLKVNVSIFARSSKSVTRLTIVNELQIAFCRYNLILEPIINIFWHCLIWNSLHMRHLAQGSVGNFTGSGALIDELLEISFEFLDYSL